jgi:DNA-binding Lrp family transcriptional regulator
MNLDLVNEAQQNDKDTLKLLQTRKNITVPMLSKLTGFGETKCKRIIDRLCAKGLCHPVRVKNRIFYEAGPMPKVDLSGKYRPTGKFDGIAWNHDARSCANRRQAMNQEDEEFERIEQEIKRKQDAAMAQGQGRDWSLLEATQESLREHMAEIKRLKALLEQPEPVPMTDEQANLLINGRGDEGDDDYVEPTGDGVGLTDEDLVKLIRRVEAHHRIGAKLWTTNNLRCSTPSCSCSGWGRLCCCTTCQSRQKI